MTNELLELIPYESENLERPAFKVSDCFLENPSVTALTDALRQMNETHPRSGIFVQMRIPRTAMHVAAVLQQCGFHFAELTLHPYTKLAVNHVLAAFSENANRFLSQARGKPERVTVEVGISERPDAAQEILELARTSFSDDRFHSDPFCDDRLADQRYVNWTRQMLKDPAVEFSLLRFDENMIGFIARKSDDLLLTASSGFADYFWLFVLRNMRNEGLSIARTTITGANPDVLNLYARLGFKFRFPELAFHYWSGASTS